MKVCKKCKIEKENSEFYSHKGTSDGLRGKCKLCYIKQCVLYNQKNKDVILDRQRENRSKNREYWREKSLENYYKHKKDYKKRIEIRNNKFPEKKVAVNTINNLIRSGKMKRQPCIICGKENANAHHPDYTKPLEVIWLCPSHHQLEHAKRK